MSKILNWQALQPNNLLLSESALMQKITIDSKRIESLQGYSIHTPTDRRWERTNSFFVYMAVPFA